MKQVQQKLYVNTPSTTSPEAMGSATDAIKYKVYGTGEATYTHKDRSSTTEIVNLDQGATVVVGASEGPPYSDAAKKRAKQLLHTQAVTRLAELCRNKGCNQ